LARKLRINAYSVNARPDPVEILWPYPLRPQ